jgi:hypothetical protein
MDSIEEIRRCIEAGLSGHLHRYGLEKTRDYVFWHREPEIILIAEINFLRKSDASYFGSTTASFSILFGGLYGSVEYEDNKDFPAVHYCHVRGHLCRDFDQAAPNPALSRAEHKRRDIWWVDKTKESAQAAIDSAGRIIESDLGMWLGRLKDRKYLCRYLYWSQESDTKLYGFGRKGSPAREEALCRITGGAEGSPWRKWTSLFMRG